MKKILLLAVLVLACIFLRAARQTAPVAESQQGRIIDMHCHIAGAGYGGSGCFISREMQNSIKFKIYLKSFGVSLREVQEQGDGLIVKKIADQLTASQQVQAAVILAMDGVISPDGSLDKEATEIYIPNEFVRREVKKYDNLYYGASINPYRRDAVARLKQAGADGAVLVKWLPSIMMIDPADMRLIPFYREMARLGLPLLTHTGDEATFTKAHNEYADPQRLELPLTQGVTVIAAHMASSGETEGQGNMARLTFLMKRYPRLYGDISALTQINRYGGLARALQDSQLHGRLLYGTDYPLINTALCWTWVHVTAIGIKEAWRIGRIENPWDRDVELKKALGLPAAVFYTAQSVLGCAANGQVKK